MLNSMAHGTVAPIQIHPRSAQRTATRCTGNDSGRRTDQPAACRSLWRIHSHRLHLESRGARFSRRQSTRRVVGSRVTLCRRLTSQRDPRSQGFRPLKVSKLMASRNFSVEFGGSTGLPQSRATLGSSSGTYGGRLEEPRFHR